jgi:UDP-N-acetylmuramate: L-alanyl-gamma-D-glutamyl-meso-diaminopimelate ligase
VVVGNAISRGNVELEYVLDERVPFRSLPDTLYDLFLRTRDPIVVAGTHGKTTTTSMLAWIFQAAGKDPSFLIGGIAENFGSSFALRQGKHFILEGDEYDTAFFDKGPKFLHYFPQALVLTSVEFDHADIYSDLAAVKTAFKRLVNLVPRRGKIIAYDADANVDECLAKSFTPVERYGLKEGSYWQITNLVFEPGRTAWSVRREGQAWADFEFPLAGEYNVVNATGAAAMAAHYGIEAPAIAEALKTFKSVKRRLEVRAEIDGIIIIDDFAHHPTAIAATLNALRTRYPGARLWAIFEPRSNTLRRKVLQKELVKSLALADQVVIASIFRPEAVPENERLRPHRLSMPSARTAPAPVSCRMPTPLSGPWHRNWKAAMWWPSCRTAGSAVFTKNFRASWKSCTARDIRDAHDCWRRALVSGLALLAADGASCGPRGFSLDLHHGQGPAHVLHGHGPVACRMQGGRRPRPNGRVGED